MEPSSSDKLWNYRFSKPGGSVVGTGVFNGDASAETRAREMSRSNDDRIVLYRHRGRTDVWEYVTEVDGRS